MKTHAREYLLEISENAGTEYWLKLLILAVISCNGKLTSEKFQEIYDIFKAQKNGVLPSVSIEGDNSQSQIELKSLWHKSGVNALKNDQKIFFSNAITILYGLNGSGKSSYFRILNELVGGNKEKKILQNIYAEAHSPIDVSVDYAQNGKLASPISWTGDTRAIAPLTCCRVFDSSYMQGLLEPHAMAETLVFPLGLHLFSTIANILSQFKECIESEVASLNNSKPVIDQKFFSPELSALFNQSAISKDKKEKIRELYIFSGERKTRLDELTKQISELKQNDPNSKIKLYNTYLSTISKVKNAIAEQQGKIKTFNEAIANDILQYHLRKTENDKLKQQTKILSTIPEIKSTEWNAFIRAGAEYTNKLSDKSHCPYCRQLLGEDARWLILAYIDFIEDQTGNQLQQASNELFQMERNLQSWSFDLITSLDADIKKIFEAHYNDGDSLSRDWTNFIEFLPVAKTTFKDALSKKGPIVPFDIPDMTIFLAHLNAIENKITAETQQLSDSKEENAKTIATWEEEQKRLLENKSIADQKKKIEQWVYIDDEIARLRLCINKLSTKPITDKATVANNELLTEALKDRFAKELDSFGFSYLQVTLEKGRSTKGVSTSKLSLVNNNSINSILSEGEQKAVALALFLAESQALQTPGPLIFDDPVTSLDHKIAGYFATRLMQSENQIIIFTHSKLFLDTFESSKDNHICKNLISCCNTRGKHIKIYLVQSESQHAKGVLRCYKGTRAKDYLADAQKELEKTPFSSDGQVSFDLRRAVECIIDEVVFKNLIPPKCSNKNSRINWDELKKLSHDEKLIDTLHQKHDRLSGGELHTGTESSENPISIDEFNDILCSLTKILVPDKGITDNV